MVQHQALWMVICKIHVVAVTVTGWGTLPVKVQGWEHFSTDIRSLSFSASIVFLVGSSEVA